MSSPAANKRRIDQDVMRLIGSNHEVEIKDSLKHFMVKFHGPKNTPYEGGMWKIRVVLPDNYPFKSPSIGFINRIFHPNIDEASGSVCLDVINQMWTPVYDLVNVFETFLPQLLTYPNAADPLNSEAATMLMARPSEYDRRIKENIRKYATPDAFEKIRDKGIIFAYPSTSSGRMHRAVGSTSGSSSSSVVGVSNVGAAAALVSTSMPPNNVIDGLVGRSGSVIQAPSLSTAMPLLQLTDDSSSRNPATSDINVLGTSIADEPIDGLATGVADNSDGHATNGASSHNGAAVAVGGISALNNNAVEDDAESVASDLSVFSENEADHMEL